MAETPFDAFAPPESPLDLTPERSNFRIRVLSLWQSALFVLVLLFTYWSCWMSISPSSANGNAPDPHDPTWIGWLLSALISALLVIVSGFAWSFRRGKAWRLSTRLWLGLGTYVGLIAGAAMLILPIGIWVRLSQSSEVDPPMKAGILCFGIHLVALLFWLPLHLLTWALPCAEVK